eukprot:CAMPEP_0179008450 /NCGR_PEP_ID=MMETSP0795-20121207/15721_1 /TAXON_ID=88552 /ORGANISM="Amoebophrya sp., Strain Ameob2" /LENGTH=233 /DNA_ID=CAMNT_0020703533 /DNA_START=249 /DNA_END=950 /DNA_ORIENTATION=-
MPRVPRERNPLLQKDEVGRAKFSAYDLPAETHSFGNGNGCDMEGAGEILRSWAAHQKSAPARGNKTNYIQFNRQQMPRKSTGAPKTTAVATPTSKGRGKAAEPSRGRAPEQQNNEGFGRPTRGSTPIGRVIGNLYAVEYEQMREKQEEAEKTAVKPKNVIYQTKASQGHKKGAEKRLHAEEHHAPFMMKKFLNVKASFHLPGNKKEKDATQLVDEAGEAEVAARVEREMDVSP